MSAFKKHYFENVPGIGNVAVTRHAQQRAIYDGLTEEIFVDVLFNGKQTPDGPGNILVRKGIFQLAIVTPANFSGAKLCVSAYKLKAHATTR